MTEKINVSIALMQPETFLWKHILYIIGINIQSCYTKKWECYMKKWECYTKK
jgi:hypothetical protein